jgi:hypothetical protein
VAEYISKQVGAQLFFNGADRRVGVSIPLKSFDLSYLLKATTKRIISYYIFGKKMSFP